MAAFSSAGAGCEYMLINRFNLNIFKLIHKAVSYTHLTLPTT